MKHLKTVAKKHKALIAVFITMGLFCLILSGQLEYVTVFENDGGWNATINDKE